MVATYLLEMTTRLQYKSTVAVNILLVGCQMRGREGGAGAIVAGKASRSNARRVRLLEQQDRVVITKALLFSRRSISLSWLKPAWSLSASLSIYLLPSPCPPLGSHLSATFGKRSFGTNTT